jgi:hypothetical protein
MFHCPLQSTYSVTLTPEFTELQTFAVAEYRKVYNFLLLLLQPQGLGRVASSDFKGNVNSPPSKSSPHISLFLEFENYFIMDVLPFFLCVILMFFIFFHSVVEFKTISLFS